MAVVYDSKHQLRQFWLQHRLTLSEAEKNARSFQIQELLFDTFPIQKAENVHLFLPVHEKCEVRTWAILQYIQQKLPQVHVVVPRISDIKNRTMESIRVESHTQFVKNKWGIEEPEAGHVVPAAMLDVVFLPLIVCDKNGHRLGYGGGFYDRYLPHCTSAIKIGLSYFDPIEQIPEISPFDVKMDYCVTPKQVFKF
jgi:5-formyltetrahydrofolate cyclo-ligase